MTTQSTPTEPGPVDGPDRPSLVVSALSNWAALAVTILVGFFLTPFVIQHVGKGGYGIWTLVATLVGYYGILDLGISTAVVRYVAHHAGRGDTRALNETASTAITVFVVMGLVVLGASVALATPLAHFFHIAEARATEFRHVVWLLGLACAIAFPGNVLAGVMRAHERFVAFNAVTLLSTLVRAGLTVWALVAGYGLTGVALATAAAGVITVVANALLCRVLLPHVRFRPGLCRRAVLRSLVAFGVAATVIAMGDLLRFKLDPFLLGKWKGMNAVAVYGVAALLIHYMLTSVTAGLGVLTPRFASLQGDATPDRLRGLFVRSLSISSALGFGAGTLVICCGGPFVHLWVGPTFRGGVPVLWILGASYAVAMAQTPGISAMYAMNRHRAYALANTLEGVANLALSLALISSYGIIGVALGTAIPQFVHKGFVQPVYVSRIVGVPLRRYVLACVPGATAGAVVVGAVIASGWLTEPQHGWLVLIAQGAGTSVVFLALWLGLTLALRRWRGAT